MQINVSSLLSYGYCEHKTVGRQNLEFHVIRSQQIKQQSTLNPLLGNIYKIRNRFWGTSEPLLLFDFEQCNDCCLPVSRRYSPG
jgi:hypothetical protein